MREILFRGKRVDTGEWVYGYFGIDDNKPLIAINKENGINGYFVYPDTVGQYTGLKDKNGKKIFEGDIIKSEQDGMIGVIRFGEYQTTNSGNGECHLGFSIEWYGKYSDIIRRDLGWWVKAANKDINIVGNIHDNPELLENILDPPELSGGVKRPTDEMELVNNYSRRELTRDEVYIFSVVLCDNEIDRDFERFTVESLEKLSQLFVGKTGILDHNPKAENQTARIISCKVEAVQGKKNSVGDDYFRLTARVYMPKTEGNKELRLKIDSGITREVSVGCSVKRTVCSICGEDINSHKCPHVKGKTYGGKLCYGELIDPCDAYEFGFVEIPKQPEVEGWKK